jgi:phosphoribosylaminoimidazole-succinocarboxamide synthase
MTTSTPDENRLWTVVQVAKAAQIHRQTVLHAIWRGDLPAQKIGGIHVIPGAEALSYIESRRSGGVR